MSNDRHIDWLLEGDTDWNRRRDLDDFCPNFSFDNFPDRFDKANRLDHNGRIPLYRLNLSHAKFMGCNLSNADFFETNLHSARFLGCNLKGANFFQADLTKGQIRSGYLGDTNFSYTILKNTDFVGENLIGTDLSGSRYWRAKLFPDTNDPIRSSSYRIYRIKNIAELIEICFEIKNRYEGLEIYFRGERDRSWCLSPSVMRPSKDGRFKLRLQEGGMLRGLIANRPEDFLGMNSALEQMVVAQHHGLKTRLLDVTPNPGVALFSACDPRDPAGYEHDNHMDGRIHVFAVPQTLVKSFDSDTVSVIANFAKLDRSYQNLLLGKTGEDSVSEDPESPIQSLYDEALRRLYHYIRQEKPQFEKLIDPRHFLQVFVVEPKQSFERIRAQKGAFLISAFHERFEQEQVKARVKNVPIYEHETIIVPAKAKAPILRELNLLSFTRENLYPSLDEVADRITRPFL